MGYFFQKHIKTINTAKVSRGLSELLSLDIQHIIPEIQSDGHSGATYKFLALERNEQRHVFILKKVLDASYYNFYKEVLKPNDLNSPEIFGMIQADENLFLVMEYILHEPTEWENKLKFKRAVEWLVKKDTIAFNNLSKLTPYAGIQNAIRDGVDEWLEIFRKGAELKIHPLLTRRYSNMLFDKKTYFHHMISLLSQNRQTINHNDFQMFNILFGTDEKHDSLYIIDWSGPTTGSVCIDLAKLIRVAPDRFSSDLLETYRAHINFRDFQETFRAAQLYTNLSIFAWMVEMLLAKRKKAINLRQFQTIAKELQEY